MHGSVMQRMHEGLPAFSGDFPPESFVATSYTQTKIAHRSTAADTDYVDRLITVSTEAGTGCCFCPHEDLHTDDLDALLHSDVRQAQATAPCVRIAALDAAWSVAPSRDPLYACEASGPPTQKARLRAALIAAEVAEAAGSPRGDGVPVSPVRALMVGAVGSVIHELRGRGMDVAVTELDETLIGREISGVRVTHGDRTIDLLESAQVALVTAMTMATETLDMILERAAEHRTKIVVYSETASNFAPRLLDYGACSVLTEAFPFYMFAGKTLMSVFRSAAEEDALR